MLNLNDSSPILEKPTSPENLHEELVAIRQELIALRTEIGERKAQARSSGRSWLNLSLRVLFLLVTLAACYAAWLGAEWRASAQERRAGEELTRKNFRVLWTPTESVPVGLLPGRTSKPPKVYTRWFGGELFADLTSLSLNAQKIAADRASVDAFLDNIEHLGRLNELRIHNAPLKNSDLISIFKLKELKSLDLSLTGLEEGPIAGIQDLRNLLYFNGSHTWIDDEAAKDIAECESLRFLDLSRTRITDAGLAELLKLGSLRQLELRRSRVSPEAIAEFAMARPEIFIRYEPLMLDSHGIVDRAASRAKEMQFGKAPIYNLPSEQPFAPMQNNFGVWTQLQIR